jgi:hypothetical protein
VKTIKIAKDEAPERRQRVLRWWEPVAQNAIGTVIGALLLTGLLEAARAAARATGL